MSTFHERKAERIAYFETYVNGWKQRKCTACNGSGYYDNDGSPDCGACDGSGKEWYKPVTKEPTALDVDWLSNVIREANGDNRLGAGALAEKIITALKSLQ